MIEIYVDHIGATRADAEAVVATVTPRHVSEADPRGFLRVEVQERHLADTMAALMSGGRVVVMAGESL